MEASANSPHAKTLPWAVGTPRYASTLMAEALGILPENSPTLPISSSMPRDLYLHVDYAYVFEFNPNNFRVTSSMFSCLFPE